MNTTTFQGGSLVSLLFLDGSEIPAYVLRIPRDRSRPERVLANFRALQQLQNVEAVKGTVPEPVFRGDMNGTAVTVESCMHGESLFARLSADHSPDRGESVLEAVFDWLWRLHSATWEEAEPAFGDELEHHLQRIVHAGILERHALNLLTEAVAQAVSAAIPFAFCQGDFNANNVLVTEGGLVSGVVDWEYSGVGPAVFDLLAIMRGSILRPELDAGPIGDQIEALLAGQHSTSRALLRSLNRYAHPRSHRPLLLVYVASLIGGFLRSTGKRNEPELLPWIKYLNSLPQSPRLNEPPKRNLIGIL